MPFMCEILVQMVNRACHYTWYEHDELITFIEHISQSDKFIVLYLEYLNVFSTDQNFKPIHFATA